MSIENIRSGVNHLTPSQLSGETLADSQLLTMAAPPHVESPIWNLSDVNERRALLADASGATPAVVGTTQRAETCTVELRYTPVAGGLANHAFVVTRDNGSTDYFRGGPSAGGPGSSNSSASTPSGSSSPATEQLGSASGGASSGASGSNSSGSSNSSNSTSPGAGRGGDSNSGGPWGSIVTEYGPYRRGTVDWTTNPTATTVVEQRPGSCDALDSELARHADDIEAARIPYNPLGANSNATARTILERSGINPGDPAVWAPGWSTRLP